LKKVALFFAPGSAKPQTIEKIKAFMPDSEFACELSIVNALDNKQDMEKKIVVWCSGLKL
jgi:hypothetical protein